MASHSPAGWYRDPAARFEFRYWDGYQWTAHVSSPGFQGLDPLPPSTTGSIAMQMSVSAQPPALGQHAMPVQNAKAMGVQGAVEPLTVHHPDTSRRPDARRSGKAQRQDMAWTAMSGPVARDDRVLRESVLVVSQKAKLVEVRAEYRILDQNGGCVASVRESGRSILKNVVSPIPESSRSHRLQIFDPHGGHLMTLAQPASLWKAKVDVRDSDGREIGQIVQRTLGMFRGVRFALMSHDREVGSIEAEELRNFSFCIMDDSRNEIGRVSKTWAGLAKEIFSQADNYVVQIRQPLDEPLRSLVVCAAIVLDTVLWQDDTLHRNGRRAGRC